VRPRAAGAEAGRVGSVGDLPWRVGWGRRSVRARRYVGGQPSRGDRKIGEGVEKGVPCQRQHLPALDGGRCGSADPLAVARRGRHRDGGYAGHVLIELTEQILGQLPQRLVPVTCLGGGVPVTLLDCGAPAGACCG
jgi:hypothetical protein